MERTDAELLANADDQSAAFFLAAAGRPWADVRVDPDVIHGTTGIPLAEFNGATAARFTAASADERIEAVLRPFRASGTDMTWWVGPTSEPPDLADRLVGHGLVPNGVVPVMARSLVSWSPAPLPAGQTTERVVDAAGFHDAMQIMFAGFELPGHLLPVVEERYAGFAIGPAATHRVHLVRLEGQAVATALGFVHDGVVGIYNVATLPSQRRRGAGSAATSAALTESVERGTTAAILESSEAGRPVYERLGFREIGTVTILLGAFSAGLSGA